RRRHERHRREVVELARTHFVDEADERELIEQIRRLDRDSIEQVLDAPEVRRACPADRADDFVSLREQELGEIGSVLPRDSGDKGPLVISNRWFLDCVPTGAGPPARAFSIRARLRTRPAVVLAALTAVLYLPRLGAAPVYLAPDEVFIAVHANSIATTGRDL